MAVGALLDRSRASTCGIGVVRDLRGVQRGAATAAINGVPRIESRKADGAFAALETVAGGRDRRGAIDRHVQSPCVHSVEPDLVPAARDGQRGRGLTVEKNPTTRRG